MKECQYCSKPHKNKSVYHVGNCPYEKWRIFEIEPFKLKPLNFTITSDGIEYDADHYYQIFYPPWGYCVKETI